MHVAREPVLGLEVVQQLLGHGVAERAVLNLTLQEQKERKKKERKKKKERERRGSTRKEEEGEGGEREIEIWRKYLKTTHWQAGRKKQVTPTMSTDAVKTTT